MVRSKSCYRSVFGLTGAVSDWWSDSPVSDLAGEVGESLFIFFLSQSDHVYCRINKVSTDNSSETLTQGLWNLEYVQSTVMKINRHGRTYRNGILVTKFRVSYVKITSTKRNTGRHPIDPTLSQTSKSKHYPTLYYCPQIKTFSKKSEVMT